LADGREFLLQEQEGWRVSEITVEFFGIPRQRAGRSELVVQATTIAEVLSAVERVCPGLHGLVSADGRPAPHYLLSLNGRRFTDDPCERRMTGDRVLLLSADIGG
jgi:molybdopterin converting factor small subunit